MNTFIQWQETISDAYLTDTPPYFPFIEPNVSLLPQGSLAGIPSNALINVLMMLLILMQSSENKCIQQSSLHCQLSIPFESH